MNVDILKAIIFASKKHQNQIRKDINKSPYIIHPLAVAKILAEELVLDNNILIGAILHDIIEDTFTTYDEICGNFNKIIANYVVEVTELDKTMKERRASQLFKAPKLSVGAALIRIADKIHNISNINRNEPLGWDEKRKIEYLYFCKQIVDKINLSRFNNLKKRFYDLYTLNIILI